MWCVCMYVCVCVCVYVCVCECAMPVVSCSVLHNRPHVAEEQIIEESTSDGEDVAIDQLKVGTTG